MTQASQNGVACVFKKLLSLKFSSIFGRYSGIFLKFLWRNAYFFIQWHSFNLILLTNTHIHTYTEKWRCDINFDLLICWFGNKLYRDETIVVSFRSRLWDIVNNRELPFWYTSRESRFYHGDGIFNASSAGWKSVAIETKFSGQSPIHGKQTWH